MNWLQDLGYWFADNWTDLGNLIFAAVVAWTAWVGVKLNRRLADAELDPAVTVYIEPQTLRWPFFDLVIRNAGRGPARNVRFTVEADKPPQAHQPESPRHPEGQN